MIENVLLVGVGGQGIILAADVLAWALVESGYDVKLSEIHGMSQRGGSVHTSVRFGEKVYSPLIERGEADHLVAFEQLEAVRWAPYARRSGRVIVADEKIKPLPVLLGVEKYPDDPVDLIAKSIGEVSFVPAVDLAEGAGNRRTANLVILGVLAGGLPVDKEVWRSVIERRVPTKSVEINLRAFELGYRWQPVPDKVL
ncbi:MAG: indolepyruvate oxidoreductase subunit beta [Actinobacteria bacterium]|nr:indolepyruvate oxidoreductase subunit beta [Actinomycetota bacterium]